MFLRNINTSSTTGVVPTAYQKGQSTDLTHQDLQWILYDRYEYNFQPIVCGLMIHLFHPTSQDVAKHNISFEEYTKFRPLLDQWISKFREFAIVTDGKEYYEGKTVQFSIAYQKGFLLLTRLKQAFKSAGYKVADDFAKIAFEKFKEKDKGAVSLNSFIAICLLLERSSMHIAPTANQRGLTTEMTYKDLQLKFNNMFHYKFHLHVCYLMIRLIHPTSQDVAIETVCVEEFHNLVAYLHKWIHAFRSLAYVWVGQVRGTQYVEAESLEFFPAIQQGVLNLARMKQALELLGFDMPDEFAKFTYDKYKEMDTGDVSLNGFIMICLHFVVRRAK
ncbi:Hypothetical predicted protein [Cloeon dipterum]|uniref:EF-hand domain-containing protein n=1 Tax=Cloeon dipterum TaxID=197152 RepID=A0A8S1BTQ4_9INSE|nr:Hypothetical predicted protein [Cloeon dipterum]